MRIPKVYGQSMSNKCPFCSRHATTSNEQEVPVCIAHKDVTLPDMKCLCGGYLDVMKGKYGVFFNCMRCGNMSSRKALEINDVGVAAASQAAQEKKAESKTQEAQKSREETVNSDDPRFF